MAKLGFINVDVNKIKCVSCPITINMKAHLNFSNDEKTAKQWYNKIRSAHLAECIFKINKDQAHQEECQAKFP